MATPDHYPAAESLRPVVGDLDAVTEVLEEVLLHKDTEAQGSDPSGRALTHMRIVNTALLWGIPLGSSCHDLPPTVFSDEPEEGDRVFTVTIEEDGFPVFTYPE